VADAGGSSNGEFMDRHRAAKNEVCWTLSVVAKQDTNAASYLKLDMAEWRLTLQLDISSPVD
jgi:hypothetical protein